jgi:hypothetical protein
MLIAKFAYEINWESLKQSNRKKWESLGFKLKKYMINRLSEDEKKANSSTANCILKI